MLGYRRNVAAPSPLEVASGFVLSRAELRTRLEPRRREMERLLLDRVLGITGPDETAAPDYEEGLRTSVSVAIDYALEAVERGERRLPPPPPALLAQARMAARNGTGLATVLRRYMAGYTLLGEVINRETEALRAATGLSLTDLLPGRGAILDRLLDAVSEEYEREVKSFPSLGAEGRTQRIASLLAGEPIDVSDIAYDFEASHVAVVASGTGVERGIRDACLDLDCRPLIAARPEGVVWAWFGARRGPDPAEVRRSLLSSDSPDFTIAIGERGDGLPGWRLTHRQAASVFPIAVQRLDEMVRYRDLALLSAAMRDETLHASLSDLYIRPLNGGRDRGEAVRATLRAYFETGCNITATAADLGVTRNTVANRLRVAEESIGQPIAACASALHTALLMVDLGTTGTR